MLVSNDQEGSAFSLLIVMNQKLSRSMPFRWRRFRNGSRFNPYKSNLANSIFNPNRTSLTHQTYPARRQSRTWHTKSYSYKSLPILKSNCAWCRSDTCSRWMIQLEYMQFEVKWIIWNESSYMIWSYMTSLTSTSYLIMTLANRAGCSTRLRPGVFSYSSNEI